jgi:hypothetical protein
LFLEREGRREVGMSDRKRIRMRMRWRRGGGRKGEVGVW